MFFPPFFFLSALDDMRLHKKLPAMTANMPDVFIYKLSVFSQGT